MCGRVVVGDVAAISRLAKLEPEVIGRGPPDHELFVMDCTMVEIAGGREIAQIVIAAAALVNDVV